MATGEWTACGQAIYEVKSRLSEVKRLKVVPRYVVLSLTFLHFFCAYFFVTPDELIQKGASHGF